ncbi:MAG: DUF58 domain-containing protein [Planctomycetes bacterium]|nr:DUF58 domain-containing protein [Planctomycetota bacterium]
MIRKVEPVEERPGMLVPELMGRVRQIQLRTHKLVNTALAGGYRSTFHGTGLEFQEVRHYQPGDDVRAIDWNVTARTGEPFIKKYAEERELTVHLLVDTSGSMDFGSGRWTKREAAAQFAALLAFVALRNQDRVGLSLFGEQPGLHLSAKKGGRHVLRIVREVIAAQPSPGGSDLHGVLEESVRGIHRRGMVFLVSDFLGAPADAREVPAERGFWLEPLRSLALRHDVIAVRVFDPLEERLPRAGLVELRDIESGRTVELDSRSRKVREGWAGAAAARRTRLLETLARARVPLLEVSADGDLADPLVAFFRQRTRRHGGRSA